MKDALLLLCQLGFSQQEAIWVFGDDGAAINSDTCCSFNMRFIADTFQVTPIIRKVGGGGGGNRVQLAVQGEPGHLSALTQEIYYSIATQK